jgi:MoxR-like ATPase
LPEAQLDRFLFKLVVDFPDRDAELEILSRNRSRPVGADHGALEVAKTLDGETLAAGRKMVDSIRLDDTILTYIVDLIRATRNDAEIRHGASTRAADALASAVRAKAAIEGRDYAIPDDVQALLIPAMRHRIVLGPTAEIEGRTPEDVLTNILNRIDAPR